MLRFKSAILPLLVAMVGIVSARAASEPAEPRALPPSGRYELDTHHASITFRVQHMGLSRTVGRFDRFKASLNLPAETPEKSTLSTVIEAASISSGIPSFDEFLRGSRFLNVAANPEIRFVSRSIVRTGESNARVTGDLTLHGVTHEVALNVVFNLARKNPFDGKQMVGFSATGTMSRAKWGLDAYAAQVSDDIELLIEAEFSYASALPGDH